MSVNQVTSRTVTITIGFSFSHVYSLYIFALVFCYEMASSQTLTLHGPPPGGKKLKHDAKVEVAKTIIKAASKVNLCRLLKKCL